MKVRDITSNDDHVVVGGKNVREYSIAATPEMYEILSAGIYQKEIPACAREVLCNAWDAHIISDLQGIPVDVTVNRDKLTIRDFGPGIADDMMETIYCTYGVTTKGENTEETGGFGLGSKAPYAYAMFMKISSFHKGYKRVYAGSKGTADTNGVPDLREIVSTRTSQSGLEVEVPIKSGSDAITFDKYIRSLVYYSGMLVRLNGEILPRLRREKIRDNIIVSTRYNKEHSPINLVYGTVVYPLPNDEAYRSLDNQIQNNFALNVMSQRNYHSKTRKMYIYLPPNSISVQASREAVKLTPHTKQFILDELIRINKASRPEMFNVLKRQLKNTCRRVSKTGSIGQVLQGFYDVKSWFSKFTGPEIIVSTGIRSSLRSALKLKSINKLISLSDEEEHELYIIFFQSCKRNFPTFVKEFRIIERIHRQRAKSNTRRGTTKYMQRLNYLNIFNRLIETRLAKNMRHPFTLKTVEFQGAERLVDTTKESYLDYPYVFIGKNQKQCLYVLQNLNRNYSDCGYPIVLSTGGGKTKTIGYFEDVKAAGLIPVDCTKIIVPKREDFYLAISADYVPQTKQSGFLALGSISEFHSEIPALSAPDTLRVEKPLVMDYIAQRDYCRRPAGYQGASMKTLAALGRIYPECALVSSCDVLERNLTKNSGIRKLRTAFMEDVFKEATANLEFAKELLVIADDNSYREYDRSSDCSKIYKFVRDFKGIPPEVVIGDISEHQKDMLIVLESYGNEFGFRNQGDLIKKLYKNPDVKKFRKRYNKFINYLYNYKVIDWDYFTDDYYYTKRMLKYGGTFRTILEYILKLYKGA